MLKIRKPTRLDLMFTALLLAALACQFNGGAPSTATTTTGTPTGGPPPAADQGPSPIDLPGTRLDHAGDINSSSMATAKSVAGGDNFTFNLYERPFNANTMDTYFPYIDIVDTQGFKDATWGYATITLAGNDSNGHLPAQYAVELDIAKQGRGAWLIKVSAPASTTWSTQGTQAWKDSNGDVGGNIPLISDKAGGDGYETLVFDQGKGTTPGGVWARISPNDPKTVQLAFKLAMLGNPASYAMGSWAGTNLDPAMYDYNDHMTHIQAGSPNHGDGIYPIKAMAEIDNTCRLAINFVPNGKEPGLCKNITPAGIPVPTGVVRCPGLTCQYGIDPRFCSCIPG